MVPWVKVGVLAVTLGLLTCGILGMLSLRMEFRPEWLMDPKSESKCQKIILKHQFVSFIKTCCC